MNSEDSLRCETFYYLREKYYGTCLSITDTYLGTASIKNMFFLVIRAYTLIKLKKIAAAIRQLTNLKESEDYTCSILIVLKIAYESENEKDYDAIKEIENELRKSRENINDKDLYLVGLVLICESSYKQFRKFIKPSHYLSESSDLISIYGWLEFYEKNDVNAAMKYFDKISLSVGSNAYPDLYLGRVRMCQEMNHYSDMIKIIEECISQYSSFMPAHIEMAKAWMTNRNWDKVNESIQIASLVNNGSVYIRFIETSYTILVKGQYNLYESVLMDLYDAVESIESNNTNLIYQISSLLLTVMMDNEVIIEYVDKFINKLLEIEESTKYEALKCQFYLKKKHYKEAYEIAKNIMTKYTGEDPNILLLLVECYVKLGKGKDARYQIDFSTASVSKIKDSTLYCYLEAFLDKMDGKPYDSIFILLHSGIDKHIKTLRRMPYGFDYFIEINCDLIINIALLLFEISPLTPSKSPSDSLKEIVNILELIHDNFRGIDKAVYLLAKAKYLQMDMDEAEKLLKKCIEKSHQIAEVHLLMAQIQVEKKNLDEASKYLDIGLSLNFKVKDHPLYHRTKALLLKKSNQIDQSISLLKQAMKLPTFEGSIDKPDSLTVSDSDRIAIYLELIDSYQILNNVHEADLVMGQAMKRWKGKPEEEQLFLMSAQLKIFRGDSDGGIAILSTITPDQVNYQVAQIKLAEVYLQEKKDPIKFAKCYKNILASNPSIQSYIMLGDAYMSIQEPIKAIEVYETAMKKNSRDYNLAEKIGSAYVKCFMYHKAITFYESALKNSRQSRMRLCFAEQLLKMGNYEKCEKILMDGFEGNYEPSDVPTLKEHVSYYMMLSTLHLEINKYSEAINDLGQAKIIQTKILSKAASEGYNIQEEVTKSADICSKIAELYLNKREYSKAADMYKEAVATNEQDIKSMIALARIYMSTTKFQQCHSQCQAILARDRYNDEATLMMADLLYQSNKSSEALLHYTQLLDRNPSQYHALARCIELCRRAGDVDQADKYLKSVVDVNPRATMDPGYNFCKGLNEWYSGEPNAALQAFNRAKRDFEWGERAIYNIIELCLNPDNEIIGEESYEVMNDQNGEEINRFDGAQTAQQFFKEIKHRPLNPVRYELIGNFILMSTTNKAQIQQALNNFLGMLQETDSSSQNQVICIGAILGSARCYIALKQQPKAKQQLKKIVNHSWSLEDADYLQQCWLLLADIYLKQGKGEQASKIIRTILQYNSSCIKAYELMAIVKERETKFYDAASNYEQAWKLSKGRNVNVGFKLAYTYMKCKHFFHSIDICNQILDKYPNYPRIKAEILDKSRAGIRI
uniref:TPR_REGION domain-containing protein n=1 Tax=Parastrongyloides trichosuri TaxID=131310 RepID=A0A0N5A168_PARTI